MTQPQTQHKTYFDPHGYFFVRLPNRAYRRPLQKFGDKLTDNLIPARGHSGPSSDSNLLSGVLRCRLFCVTPVHIGSGSYRHAPDAPGSVAADIVRNPQGNPIIPGSSLKGSFRAIAEAASKSCLLMKGADTEEKAKLPGSVGFRGQRNQHSFRPPNTSHWSTKVEQALIGAGRNVPVDVQTPSDLNHALCDESKELCPCCAIFGKLGYRGRIAFTDAHITAYLKPLSGFTPPTMVTIPARNSPQPHRLADKATWADGGLDVRLSERRTRQGTVTLVVPNPLGRKFYPNFDPHECFQTALYDWSQLRRGYPKGAPLNETFFHQQMRKQHGEGTRVPSLYNPSEFRNGEPHDVIPIGKVLEFRLHFQSLLPWELGLLLLGMGIGASWLPKVGGAKAYGLGSVQVRQQALHLVVNVATYDAPTPLSAQQLALQINNCLAAFRNHQSYHADGVADLRVGFSLNLAACQQDRRLHIAKNTTPMPT